MSNSTNGQPVRGVSTIRAELNEARNDNTYKMAFKTLGVAVVCTLLSYAGYQFLNTIYVWLWVATGIAWLIGIGMLVFSKSIENDRHRKIAALEAELAKAQAASVSVPKAIGTPNTEAPAAPARPKMQFSVGGAASVPTPVPTPAPASTLIPAPAKPAPIVSVPPTPPSAPVATAPSVGTATATPSPTTTTQPRFCNHCGKPVEGPSRFCGYCGQPL